MQSYFSVHFHETCIHVKYFAINVNMETRKVKTILYFYILSEICCSRTSPCL